MASRGFILLLMFLTLAVLLGISNANLCDYDITIKTGCDFGGGTDGKVSVSLFNGSQSQVFEHLDSHNNDFEMCSKRTYRRQAGCLPHMCQVTLSLEVDFGSQIGGDWQVNYVDIAQTNHGEHHFDFNCHWIKPPSYPVFSDKKSASATVDRCSTT